MLIHFLLSAGLVLTGPLFGWGGSARAGYVARFHIPQPRTLLPGGGPSSPDLADLGATALSGVDNESEPGGSGNRVLPWPGKRGPLVLSPAAGSAGAGSQPSSSGANQYPATVDRPQFEAATLVGFLFLQDSLARPPPFPSRVFRPPRRPEELFRPRRTCLTFLV